MVLVEGVRDVIALWGVEIGAVSCHLYELDLLHEGMKEFATASHYEPLRASLKGQVRDMEKFEFVQMAKKQSSSGSRLQHFLYKATYGESVLYWTIVMCEGKMTALNWEEK